LCACLSIKPCRARQISGLTVKTDTTEQHNANLKKGKPVPDFTLTAQDGGKVQLSSFKGHVVIIDFWASWCLPCRASIPHLKKLYEKYHGQGLEILSISIDQNSKAWQNAVAKEAMPWKQVIDKYNSAKDASEVMTSFGIESVPFLIIMDKEGKVQAINPVEAETDEQLKEIFDR